MNTIKIYTDFVSQTVNLTELEKLFIEYCSRFNLLGISKAFAVSENTFQLQCEKMKYGTNEIAMNFSRVYTEGNTTFFELDKSDLFNTDLTNGWFEDIHESGANRGLLRVGTPFERNLNGEPHFSNHGSFVTSLFLCYRNADDNNRQKLNNAFPEWFTKKIYKSFNG